MNEDKLLDAIELLGGSIQSIIDALKEVSDVLAIPIQQDIIDASKDLEQAMKAVS